MRYKFEYLMVHIHGSEVEMRFFYGEWG